jgi:XTP/dITP diphosphohydrolase
MKIVLATHNAGKIPELEAVLKQALGADFDRVSIVTSGQEGLPDPKETGTTFQQNALIKARSAAQETGLPAIADDSGLIVDILGAAPGILSARWSGQHGNDQANIDLLLAQLADIPDSQRRARFECCAAFVVPASFMQQIGAPAHAVEACEMGEMRGHLLRERRGNNGFGYDPIFVPDDQPGTPAGATPRTSAELTEEQKDSISHRGKAMRALAQDVKRILFAQS